MTEQHYGRVQQGSLHKCVIYILKACNEHSTAQLQQWLHSMCAENRYVKFELLNIHYKTRNDQIAHDSLQNSTPNSAFSHAFHVDNNLRDTYIPAVPLRSALFGLSRFFIGGAYAQYA